jgi:hypothetical protein
MINQIKSLFIRNVSKNIYKLLKLSNKKSLTQRHKIYKCFFISHYNWQRIKQINRINIKVFVTQFDGMISRMFKRKKLLLPLPYETNCFDYSENKIRSQSVCINGNLMEYYLNNYNCLSKIDEMITHVIDYYNYTKFNNKFCGDIDF